MKEQHLTTPWKVAEDWYRESEIASAIQRNRSITLDLSEKIPTDIYSPEFAKWLTHEYRLAMVKGIQIGRSCDRSEDKTKEESIRDIQSLV